MPCSHVASSRTAVLPSLPIVTMGEHENLTWVVNFLRTPLAGLFQHPVRITSVALILLALASGRAAAAESPSSTERSVFVAERIAREYMERKHVSGVALAVSLDGRSFVRGLGTRGHGTEAAVDANTSFVIGSVTKVFTSVLLTLQVNAGEMSLGDRVVRFLPEVVGNRGHTIRRVTLGELATFTAGLPRDPPREFQRDPADVLRFLTRWRGSRDRPIGSWLYSNLSYGAIGYALQHQAGRRLGVRRYSELLRERLLAPLGMERTQMPMPLGMQNRAIGYRGEEAIERPWHNAWYAAGSLSSTASDMRRFLEAAMQLQGTPPRIAAAMRLAQRVRVRPPGKPFGQALAWVRREPRGIPVISKEGGVPGFTACVAWSPPSRTGIALLANQSNSNACLPAVAILLHLVSTRSQ